MRFQPFLLVAALLVSAASGFCQDGGAQQPGQTNPQPVTPPAGVQAGPQTPAPAASKPEPVKDPYVIEDGGFYIEPFYWLNHKQPVLNATTSGVTALSESGNYGYDGSARPGFGGEIGFPAGAQNTIRVSYFRVGGSSSGDLVNSPIIFSEQYNAGDFVDANYSLQSGKVSWDYLSYNWRLRPGTLRLKTLWEFQFAHFTTNFNAPLKAVTTDSSGNTDYNTANGNKSLFFPTFGLGLEQGLGRHFRWEAQGSGFGIPGHGDLWDAHALIAVREGPVELLGGARAFHVKTSPAGYQYFADTLSGIFVGVRLYWGSHL